MCDYDIIFDIYKSDDIINLSNEEKWKHMPQLVSHFYNYLNSIEPDSIILPKIRNTVHFKNKFKIKINNLEKYINIIINFLQYSSTTVTLITNKQFLRIKYFDNYYLLLDLIIISIIIFYKYKASISIFPKIKILKKFHINDIYNDLKINDKIKKKILDHYNFEYKIPNEYYKYRYIELLNYLFFGDLKANFDNNNKYKKLNDIIIFFQDLNVIKSTNIYTIPQYEGICWFTAFINSICYSDANKNLLLSLKDTNIPDENLTISKENDNYKTILIKLVYSIINDCKVCTIIQIFKTIPILFLTSIHNDILKNGITDIKSKFFTKLATKDIDEKNYGLFYHEKDVFKDLYNFLNINSIYLIFKNNELYIKNNHYKYIDLHIILIDNAPNYDLNNLIKFDKINNYKNDIEIVYNNNTYVLDYIMYSSLHINENIMEGHVISSITYNGKEYFHDTNKFINENANVYYYFACEFVRKNWKDDFKYKNNKNFSLNKCYYINTNKSELSKQLLRYTIENEYQYSMLNNYVACYVKKIPEIPKAGGNNENLTSTNIKINVVINNKNIQRTVYINNNGIRFIKYNNKLIKIYYK
jgi:hypothetical protein